MFPKKKWLSDNIKLANKPFARLFEKKEKPSEGYTECPNCAELTYNIDLGLCDECHFTD